jgi:hypothetical protein
VQLGGRGDDQVWDRAPPYKPSVTITAKRHDGAVRPWKRRLSDDERSVLLSELLLRHPELAAEAEEITSALLVVDNDQQLADEITARLRALRPNGPVSVDTGRARVLDVLQPYIDDLTWRKERGARRAAATSRSPSCSGCTNAAKTLTRARCLSRWACPAR